MILTCPSCATSYFTPDDAIGPSGRRVRCQSCAHIWHATPEEPPLDLVAASPVIETAPTAKSGFGKRDETPETLAETPAPELPKAFRARAEQQRRLRQAATHGAVWAGLASVFVGLIATAWLFRIEVVEMYPRAAAAYAAVGAPVNPTGLEFEAMSARTSPNAPTDVLVQGALRNVRDREVVAPAVRLALLDTNGVEIGHTIVRIDSAPVLPGGVQGFAAMIPDPGARGAGIGVDFAADLPEVAPRDAEPAHDHEAPPVRRPPPAEPPPLRSALAPIESEASSGPPVDAVPLNAYPAEAAAVTEVVSTSPLDSDPA